MTADCDLVLRGGTVVTGWGSARIDVGVIGGRIAHLGEGLRGRLELDASGAVVLPGGVDMHVHLRTSTADSDLPVYADDPATGSAAAIAGGITTIGSMAFPDEGETMMQAVTRETAALSAGSATDFVTHPCFLVPDASTPGDIAAAAADGHRSIKTVTLFLDGPSGAEFVSAIAQAGELGMVTMVHCEDGPLVDFAAARLLGDGCGAPANYADSRPDISELAAVQRVIAIAEATGAPVHLVHIAGARSLSAARDARARGLPVTVETRPMYLELTRERYAEPQPGRYIGMPPLRAQADVEALWRGIADGAVHTVASDHAPYLLAEKTDPRWDIATVPKGVAELETMLPLLFDRGVASGRITLEQFAAVTATNPARRFGLYPRKGVIAVGSDADLTIVDPTVRRAVDGAAMASAADYSIYDGMPLTGWPRYVIRRGEILLGGDRPVREGGGLWLRQGPIENL